MRAVCCLQICEFVYEGKVVTNTLNLTVLFGK